ncbi:MAG: hypothetical protein QOI03_239 [Solirubrobacteraceae bacterium]|nr:hypothetical protein [Solirubrobacteraceae bacterium]
MGLTEKLTELRWRAAGHYRRPLPDVFVRELRGAHGLEVGGPSAVFGEGGLLPVYRSLASLDGVQWAASTSWHSLDDAQGYRPQGERSGELHLIDGVDLAPLQSGAYDVVLCSHVIEHLANPLRALAAWRRVTRPQGYLLMVAPHMSGTFDHRRALTPLSHMIEDFEADVAEDDLTHLEETLEHHDRSRDAEAGDFEEWAQRRRSNASTRLLHHHTFTTPSLLSLLDHAGLELIAAQTRMPHDIYVLGRWPAGEHAPENAAFRSSSLRSPFRADRE